MKKFIDPRLLNKSEIELQEFIKDKRILLTFINDGIEWTLIYFSLYDGELTRWILNNQSHKRPWCRKIEVQECMIQD